ncbi:Pyridoxal-5'-phosphate-dependent enzyme family protein [Abeliophyllum distichum]|uniref:Pyridoxal-5'-phosphate-dependent enzyme family protein n=1 Tax=Abeliophyllum distichum TaxID=126358 RepID=A0ABD1PTA3_9LAMI
MLTKCMGRKSIVTVTGAGQHWVATAAACAKLGLDCTIFMGNIDIERQSSNILLMKYLGSGSNTLGLFHEFIRDENVRLIGVEAAGNGIGTRKHSATLAKGQVGVYHGTMSYLLQDDEGQIIESHSIGVRLEYPGVSPELSFLKDIGRAEFYTITYEEALQGIFLALEAAHALPYLEKLCPTLAIGTKVVVNCSG